MDSLTNVSLVTMDEYLLKQIEKACDQARIVIPLPSTGTRAIPTAVTKKALVNHLAKLRCRQAHGEDAMSPVKHGNALARSKP